MDKAKTLSSGMDDIIKILKDKNLKTVSLFCHKNPDGDCVGALNSLKIILEVFGKTVHMYSPSGVSEHLRFIQDKFETDAEKILTSDVCLMADVNRYDGLGRYENFVRTAEQNGITMAAIDHHDNNPPLTDVGYFDCEATSTTELIYNLAKELNIELTSDLVKNLYIGIISDRLYRPKKEPARIALRDLLEKNAMFGAERMDYADIDQKLVGRQMPGAMEFRKKIYEIREEKFGGLVQIVKINNSLYNQYKAVAEAINPHALFAYDAGCEIIVRMTEKNPGEWNLSFAAQNEAAEDAFNVCKIAKLLGGGGHKASAGATLTEVGQKAVYDKKEVKDAAHAEKKVLAACEERLFVEGNLHESDNARNYMIKYGMLLPSKNEIREQ